MEYVGKCVLVRLDGISEIRTIIRKFGSPTPMSVFWKDKVGVFYKISKKGNVYYKELNNGEI